MNFFEQQDRARRRTALLVFYFTMAIALIVAAVNAVAVAVVWLNLDGNRVAGLHSGGFWSVATPKFLLLTSAATLTLILLGMAQKLYALRGGGAAVAGMLGGKPVWPGTEDEGERRLRNVVEEMALASGVAVPGVYVLEDTSINAFAAGWRPDAAVVAVTRGTLAKLNREELQAVVAHEFSHIFNGDMRINVRLLGLMHGILAIAVLGRIFLSGRSGGGGRRKGSAGGLFVLGVALLIIGYIGVFFSRFIKAAISRQREFLADASAVQFTRNPGALAAALNKIRSKPYASYLSHPQTEELSHLLFAQGFNTILTWSFDTHPPLEERIRAVDPNFSLETKAEESPAPAEPERKSAPPAPAATRTSPVAPVPLPAAALAVAAMVGRPTAEDVLAAARYKSSLPPGVTSRLESPEGGRAVVYALLLSDDMEVRRRQLEILGAEGPAAEEASRPLTEAALRLRLPLLELAIPSLRRLEEADKRVLLENAGRLAVEDNRLQPFEFAAKTILSRALFPGGKSGAGRWRAEDLPAEAACLLSYLAYAGAAGSERAAQAAFSAGFAKLGAGAKILLPWDLCGPDAASASLDRLAEADPSAKRRLLEACAACVFADGRAEPEEWEVLRAFAECLECPLPLLPPER
ncbi:MAG: M48 family metallopeptidase [Elusimicrobiota bacterium]